MLYDYHQAIANYSVMMKQDFNDIKRRFGKVKGESGNPA